MKVKPLSPVRLLATPWTAAHQAPPSMGFSRREHCSGAPLVSPKRHTLATVYGALPALFSALIKKFIKLICVEQCTTVIFKRFFWCGPFLKSSLLVTILLLLYVWDFFFFGQEACGILAPYPGTEPAPPSSEGKVFTTGMPGKSQQWLLSELAKRTHLPLQPCFINQIPISILRWFPENWVYSDA